jgi:carboxypeptidase PM20D1
MGNSIDPKGFNIDQAVEHLSQAIQINTVSYPDYQATDFARYEEFLHFLEEAYPSVNRVCQREIINDYCPFYLWKSESGQGKKPILLIGHYDVVP